jgi:serine/threonine protein kinase/tetratricopeptide (TPR) repeat protein
MTNTSRVCPKCGATVFADAPQGCCSVCLVRTGLVSFDDENDKAFEPTVERMLKDFGDYELLEEIGRGGQGIVYRARQKSLNRIVALKIIGLAHWATEAHVKRFRLEAEAAASLNHPCIVPIYEVGERDGACYFSMGLVEGGQLDAVAKSATADSSCGEREPMPLRHAAELIAKLARTVHYAHEHGILHRDIKPGNILLDAKGEPHLTDFGLARLVETESTVTRTMEVLGTPSYMAPEQAVGNNVGVTSAADIYGLGAVLYQLLTGHPPFAGGTTFETVRLVLDTEPRQPRLLNPKVDRDLATICLKCLEKDPQRRYSSALALAEDLEHWLKHEPIRARRTGLVTRGKKWVRRNPSIAVMAAMLLVLAVPLGVMIWKNESERSAASNAAPPEKSIAVLPFENLSDKENTYFADGIQNEILTKLAGIGDLKVISRSSTAKYKSKPADLKRVAHELGVATVLEGTVQRAGDKVRVNVQLLDPRLDTHLWAKSYDRDLRDVFGVQSEVAQEIADQLRVKLSPSEANALAAPITRDTEAYDLFLRGEYEQNHARNEAKKELFDRAQNFYRQALARDPNFALAYAHLAYSRLYQHWFIANLSSAELADVKSNIHRALAIAPALPDAHFVLGQFYYWAYRDYDAALKELDRAIELQPSNAISRVGRASIYRRRGEWNRALVEFQRAAELDPRDPLIPAEIGWAYVWLRRWSDAEQSLKRALAIDPHFEDAARFLPMTYVNSTGDIPRARKVYEKLQEERAINVNSGTGNIADLIGHGVYLEVIERHFADALKAWDPPLANTPEARLRQLEARVGIQVLAGQSAVAKSECEQARALLEARLAERPEDRSSLMALAWAYVCLGRNADALRVARQAIDSLPAEKDALSGSGLLAALAEIEARTGRPEEAVKILRQLLTVPAGAVISIARLKIDPVWDPIRDTPGFQKLLSEPEPATVYK